MATLPFVEHARDGSRRALTLPGTRRGWTLRRLRWLGQGRRPTHFAFAGEHSLHVIQRLTDRHTLTAPNKLGRFTRQFSWSRILDQQQT